MSFKKTSHVRELKGNTYSLHNYKSVDERTTF